MAPAHCAVSALSGRYLHRAGGLGFGGSVTPPTPGTKFASSFT